MKGIKVKMNDINAGSTFEMVKLVVRIISITKGLTLSETELYALTYFVINGYSKISRENLISSKLLKNKQSEANLMHSFRKYGILTKSNFGENINSDYNIPTEGLDAIKFEMLVKK